MHTEDVLAALSLQQHEIANCKRSLEVVCTLILSSETQVRDSQKVHLS